jgi:hypothetical protein
MIFLSLILTPASSRTEMRYWYASYKSNESFGSFFVGDCGPPLIKNWIQILKERNGFKEVAILYFAEVDQETYEANKG